MSHRLDPLLRPRSVAVLGASERPGSVGHGLVNNLLAGSYEGKLYPVNPGRESVLGLACFPNLAALPETVDHVAFALSDRRLEAALDEAINHGARAATILSQLLVEGDEEPMLETRVRRRLIEAGILVCGGNSMGFYNCQHGVWMGGFATRANHPRGGNVAYISHSGAGMSCIMDPEERIDFNLAVSSGTELTVAMHEYMDYAIEELDTRVIGLFMETVRDTEGMCAALEKANRRHIPVVALKVGRTALSASMVQSHSGAIAGEDAAYEALFDRYGVQRVQDFDELATTLIMFAQPHAVGDGGLVALHDSGGERQLMIDLAAEMGTPLTEISAATEQTLEKLLDPGLPALNPLDAWGAGGPDSDLVMQRCFAALMEDPGAALGVVQQARGPVSKINPELVEYTRAGQVASGKPAFLVAARQGSGMDPQVPDVTRQGLPVLDGVRSFLAGVNAMLGYRDFCRRPEMNAPTIDATAIAAAREVLQSGAALGEAESNELLAAIGLPVNPSLIAHTEEESLHCAERMGYPVVMKTAAPGMQHKTEHAGVHLRLGDEAAVRTAWQDLFARLGPRVLIAPMVDREGVEMTLGMVRDPQFGALVMLGFGGTRLEAIKDVVYAFPPFEAATARRLLGKLQQQPLLEFDRGAGPPNLVSYCEAAALFSAMVASLGDAIDEIDINPLLVHAGGCVAVDTLLIGAARDPLESRKAS